MKRVALLVQYDGSHYSGWQKQKNANTVQEIIERALLKITNHTVKTFAAGRTDAGVHASGQVVHFDVDSVIPANSYSVEGPSAADASVVGGSIAHTAQATYTEYRRE